MYKLTVELEENFTEFLVWHVMAYFMLFNLLFKENI